MKKDADKALHLLAAYCSRAERCEFDITKKMESWELSEEQQKKIIQRLKSENFLNEERFCKSFINDKFKYNKWGTNKIAFELKKKNIAEDIYKPILEDLDSGDIKEQLTHILKQKVKSTKANSDYERKAKLIKYAVGKGFDMGLSIQVANNIIKGGDDFENYL